MQLIDGYNGGVAHISAGMIRDHNISLYGDGDYVLPVGSKFSYDVVNNNTIRISDGMAVIGGARAIIEYGKIETVVIENGVSGYKRNDIIVIEYTKDNETLVESASVKVVKGQLGSSGVDPTLIDGNVRAGATAKQMALYRVRINGLSIEGVDTLWDSAVFPVTAGGTGVTSVSSIRDLLGIKQNEQAIIALASDMTLSSNEVKIPLTASVSNLSSPLFVQNYGGMQCWAGSTRVRVDISIYLFNKFTEKALVTVRLYNGDTDTGFRFNKRPVVSGEYTHITGSALVNVNNGDILYLKASVSSGSGVISASNIETRMIVSTTW